jgi:hypothetical protein
MLEGKKYTTTSSRHSQDFLQRERNSGGVRMRTLKLDQVRAKREKIKLAEYMFASEVNVRSNYYHCNFSMLHKKPSCYLNLYTTTLRIIKRNTAKPIRIWVLQILIASQAMSPQ